MVRKSLIGFLMAIVFVGVSHAGDRPSPYSRYQVPKVVTQLEWRLLKMGLHLAAEKAHVSYNSQTGLFEVTAWVLTTDVTKSNTKILRDNFSALANLAGALIGREFQEFRDRGEKGLLIQWRLGRAGDRQRWASDS